MARTLTANFKAELSKGMLRPAIFVEIEFTSGTVYCWSGIGSKSWNGQTWTGVGNLGTISVIPETTEVKAEGVQLSLSGIPASYITYALSEIRQGKLCKVWFGFLDSTLAVIADPAEAFGGRIDVPVIDEGAGGADATATITITVESHLIDLQRARDRRYTDSDQQMEYSGDKGFEFVPAVQQWNGTWGKSGTSTSGGSGYYSPPMHPPRLPT